MASHDDLSLFPSQYASHLYTGRSTNSEHIPPSAASEPVSGLAQLQGRIAQLETELFCARGQRDTAQTANTYLLEVLVKNGGCHCQNGAGSVQRLAAAKRENRRLRAKLALAIQESHRWKAKTRLTPFGPSPPKQFPIDFEITKSSASFWNDKAERPAPVLGTLIDLLENEADEQGLVSVLRVPPDKILSPKDSSPHKSNSSTKSSTDAALNTQVFHQPHLRNGVAPPSSMLQSKHCPAYRPNYVHYVFGKKEPTRIINSSEVDRGTIADNEPKIQQTTGQGFIHIDEPLNPTIVSSSVVESAEINQLSPELGPARSHGLYMSAWAPAQRPPGVMDRSSSRRDTSSPGQAFSGIKCCLGSETSITLNSSSEPVGQANHPACGSSDTRIERERAIEINKRSIGPADLYFPDAFEYGLFYKPSEDQSDIYRTVIMDNLPNGVTLAEVMAEVRGGVVVEVDLLDTSSIGGCKSAMIVFLHESSATNFAAYASTSPIRFSERRASVTQLQTPTWPLNARLRKAILDYGHTRCLIVRDLPSDITYEQFRYLLGQNRYTKHDSLQSVRKDSDGTIHTVFQSVDAAGRAYARLTTFRDFEGCQVAYAPDPCSQPLSVASEGDGCASRGPGDSAHHEVDSNNTPNISCDAGDDAMADKSTARAVDRYVTAVNASGHLERKVVCEKFTRSPVPDTSTQTNKLSPKLLAVTASEAEEDLLIDLSPTDETASSAASSAESDDTLSPNGTLRTRSGSRESSTTTVTVVPCVSVTAPRCHGESGEVEALRAITTTY